MKQYRFAVYAAIGITALLMTGMLLFPQEASAGAARGLLLCGSVVIPSLYPYTVCVLFLMKTGVTELFSLFRRFSELIYRQSGEQHGVMLLSMIGGYPTGARMIDELVRCGRITPKRARLMQCFCVNAGPGFIVLAVGGGILHSETLGWMLLAAHLIPPLLLAMILGRLKAPSESEENPKCRVFLSVPDAFVAAAADGAGAVFSVCTFVIFFSAVQPILTLLSAKIVPLRRLLPLIEVTTGITAAGNLYAIAFLLGFAGFSVWFQVRAVSANYGMDLPFFLLSRLFHGGSSALILHLLFRIFPHAVPTVGNGAVFTPSATVSGIKVSVSLIMMTVLFLFSLFYEKKGRKIREELI